MDTSKFREIAKELTDKYTDNGSHCLVMPLNIEGNILEYYCVFGKYLNKTVLVSPYAFYKIKVCNYDVMSVENVQVIGIKNEPSEVISLKDGLNECLYLGHRLSDKAIVGNCIRCGKQLS